MAKDGQAAFKTTIIKSLLPNTTIVFLDWQASARPKSNDSPTYQIACTIVHLEDVHCLIVWDRPTSTPVISFPIGSDSDFGGNAGNTVHKLDFLERNGLILSCTSDKALKELKSAWSKAQSSTSLHSKSFKSLWSNLFSVNDPLIYLEAVQARTRAFTDEKYINGNENIFSKAFFELAESIGDSECNEEHYTSELSRRTNNIKSSWLKTQLASLDVEFVTRSQIRARILSWNVNGVVPTGNVHDWLFCDTRDDLIIIGLQEMDLTNEAYIRNNTPLLDSWSALISENLGQNYLEVFRKQLIGITLFVYCKGSCWAHISNVESSYAACGVMGLLGNKGAVAIRLHYGETPLTFVCCHFAAQTAQVVRRNNDYNDISRKLVQGDKQILQSDPLFLLGDLNYRLDLPDEHVRKLHAEGHYESLLRFDQLRHQQVNGMALEGFHEANISFPATFKYDKGSSNFDTSEKHRTPSWTDRILWRSDHVKPVDYQSVMSCKQSDHKPIYLTCDIDVRIIETAKLMATKQSLLRKLDRLENDALPSVGISSNKLDFEGLYYGEQGRKQSGLKNRGAVPAYFIAALANGQSPPDWIRIWPQQGFIVPGETVNLEVNVVASKEAMMLENSKQDLIVVLKLMGANQIYISVSVSFKTSFLGKSLEDLRNTTEPGQMKTAVPSPLKTILDNLLSKGADFPNLFMEYSEPEPMALVLKHFDSNPSDSSAPVPIDEKTFAIALSDILLLYLDLLPQPFLGHENSSRCLECIADGNQNEVFGIMGETQMNLIIRLSSLLRMHFTQCNVGEQQRDMIVDRLAGALFRGDVRPEKLGHHKALSSHKVHNLERRLMDVFISDPSS